MCARIYMYKYTFAFYMGHYINNLNTGTKSVVLRRIMTNFMETVDIRKWSLNLPHLLENIALEIKGTIREELGTKSENHTLGTHTVVSSILTLGCLVR